MATQSKTSRHSLMDIVRADRNIVAAGYLSDLANLQSNERSSFGYKRAAKVLATGLDRSVVDLIEEGTLRDVPFVGASTERVVAELVKTGASASVERSIAASSKRTDVEKRRTFRRAYLSRHTMRLALDAPLSKSMDAPCGTTSDWPSALIAILARCQPIASCGATLVESTRMSVSPAFCINTVVIVLLAFPLPICTQTGRVWERSD